MELLVVAQGSKDVLNHSSLFYCWLPLLDLLLI